MDENSAQVSSPMETQMLFSMRPDTTYFEMRFKKMESQIDEVRRNQDSFQEQFRDFKYDVDRRFTETRSDVLERFSLVDKRFEQVDKRFEQVDKRFEQVDKQFEQVIASIEKLGEKMDRRDEKFGEKMDRRDEKFGEKIDQINEKFGKKIDHIDKQLGEKIDKIDEKLGGKIDHRDERQRRFTLRMFNIAISISCLSVFGVLMKVFNIL